MHRKLEKMIDRWDRLGMPVEQRLWEALAMIGAMHEQRLDLDRRIHNQRHACRLTWETIEMRNDWRIHTSEVRTKMLKYWCAASREVHELRQRLAALGQTKQDAKSD